MAFALIARAKDGSLRLLDTQMFTAPSFAMARLEALADADAASLRSSEIMLADLDSALPVLVVWPSGASSPQPASTQEAAAVIAPTAPPAIPVAEQPAPDLPRLREDSDLFIITANGQRVGSLTQLIASAVDDACVQRGLGTAVPSASATGETETCDDCVFRETCPDAGPVAAENCGAFQRL